MTTSTLQIGLSRRRALDVAKAGFIIAVIGAWLRFFGVPVHWNMFDGNPLSAWFFLVCQFAFGLTCITAWRNALQ